MNLLIIPEEIDKDLGNKNKDSIEPDSKQADEEA